MGEATEVVILSEAEAGEGGRSAVEGPGEKQKCAPGLNGASLPSINFQCGSLSGVAGSFHQRLIAAGKKKMVALTAVMRKLIVLLNRLLKDLHFVLRAAR